METNGNEWKRMETNGNEWKRMETNLFEIAQIVNPDDKRIGDKAIDMICLLSFVQFVD